MSKKNKPDSRGFVFSTDPNFKFEEEHHSDETLLPAQQKQTAKLDTKHRAGKAVTLVEGFIGKEEDLEELGKKLKALRGTGGSRKDGERITQGGQRETGMEWFGKNGYKNV